jgi:hypothetical protein
MKSYISWCFVALSYFWLVQTQSPPYPRVSYNDSTLGLYQPSWPFPIQVPAFIYLDNLNGLYSSVISAMANAAPSTVAQMFSGPSNGSVQARFTDSHNQTVQFPVPLRAPVQAMWPYALADGMWELFNYEALTYPNVTARPQYTAHGSLVARSLNAIAGMDGWASNFSCDFSQSGINPAEYPVVAAMLQNAPNFPNQMLAIQQYDEAGGLIHYYNITGQQTSVATISQKDWKNNCEFVMCSQCLPPS